MYLVFLLHPHRSVDLLEVCRSLGSVKKRFEDIEKQFMAFKKSAEDEIVLVEAVESNLGFGYRYVQLTLRVPITIETLTKETPGVKVMGSLRDLQFFVDAKTCSEDDDRVGRSEPPEPPPPEVVVRCDEIAKKAGRLATLSLFISISLIVVAVIMNLVEVYNPVDDRYRDATRKLSFVAIILFICTLIQTSARELLHNVGYLCMTNVCLRTSILVALVLAVTIFVGVVYV